MNAPDALARMIARQLDQSQGWMGFDRFMALALYAPMVGYYSGPLPKLGRMPESGSDFVTAPELSPWFGRTLARSVAQALAQTGTSEVWEFGAGSGALATQLIQSLGNQVRSYHIVDLSGSLRQRQQEVLSAFSGRVFWHDEWPEQMAGVVVGNELLDAMPVQLLSRVGGVWHERGVVAQSAPGRPWTWLDRPTHLRPPTDIEGQHDYLTEIHPQAEAFIHTLAQRLSAGAVFLIDYGFPEREYYHPQRHMGTLMCHQGHRSDPDPLRDVGAKDITAHVNFTSVAVAAQEAGLEVLGYTSQARFLINSGLVDLLQEASLPERAMAQKLLTEHEMGELFKVIALGVGPAWEPMGFAQSDRTHSL
ncbi:MAG: SAM-dependent methyltransferase [Alphaproteobacteria bacterium]|nr:SAM-dependent methyltransferase [Alphaproteobacteria bacterium]MDI9329882.1 SAM-dependent methyltransferase [Alphaproteobacteria bacterium]